VHLITHIVHKVVAQLISRSIILPWNPNVKEAPFALYLIIQTQSLLDEILICYLVPRLIGSAVLSPFVDPRAKMTAIWAQDGVELFLSPLALARQAFYHWAVPLVEKIPCCGVRVFFSTGALAKVTSADLAPPI
jgi:hypothetical protein